MLFIVYFCNVSARSFMTCYIELGASRPGRKSERERFAGADETYTIEARRLDRAVSRQAVPCEGALTAMSMCLPLPVAHRSWHDCCAWALTR